MKKNIKIIVIFLIVVAVLAGLLIFLKVTAPEEEIEEAAEETVSTSLLYDKNPYDISLLTIENEHGTYQVERVGEGDNAGFTIMELSSLPLGGDNFTALIEKAATLTAQQTVVENADDLSIYGLDTPSAKVTVNFTDSSNTVKTLIVGNLAPDGNKRYLMVEGDSKVYTVYNNAVSCFLNDKYSAVNRTVYTAKSAESEEDTTDYTRINKMTIKRPDLDYDFVIEYDVRLDDPDSMNANSSSYVITSPVYRDLNPENSADVTDGIFGLTASDLAVLNPTEEDMNDYGINEPLADVSVEINGGDTLRFRIGSECYDDEGVKEGYFVYVDGINIIYIFAESSLPWLDVMPLDICTTMFTSNYVYDIEALDIIYNGGEMHFTMTGSTADDFAVKLDGVDMENIALFKNFYQFILRAPSSEIYFGEAEGEPSLTINIQTANGGDLIEFFPSDNRQSIIRLNGQVTYKCATAYVDRFSDNIEHYKNGEDIITSW